MGVPLKLFVFLGAGFVLAMLIVPLEARTAETASLPECVRTWADVRYRPFGYDHLVHIHNDCDRTADCTITTDVNPDRIEVSVSPGGEVEVVTWARSPWRAFTASVACRLR